MPNASKRVNGVSQLLCGGRSIAHVHRGPTAAAAAPLPLPLPPPSATPPTLPPSFKAQLPRLPLPPPSATPPLPPPPLPPPPLSLPPPSPPLPPAAPLAPPRSATNAAYEIVRHFEHSQHWTQWSRWCSSVYSRRRASSATHSAVAWQPTGAACGVVWGTYSERMGIAYCSSSAMRGACHEEGSGRGTTFRDVLRLPGHT
eukprot:105777-Chlamydomonas_euryale.AAC.2